MPAPLADDDVVATHADASSDARAPLVVLEPLREFLAQHGLARTADDEPAIEPLGEGQSNVTLLLRLADHELVLRRPPRGPLPPSAHDVLHEARLLRALAPTAARVPRVLAVGEDPALIGAPSTSWSAWRARSRRAACPPRSTRPPSAGGSAGSSSTRSSRSTPWTGAPAA